MNQTSRSWRCDDSETDGRSIVKAMRQRKHRGGGWILRPGPTGAHKTGDVLRRLALQVRSRKCGEAVPAPSKGHGSVQRGEGPSNEPRVGGWATTVRQMCDSQTLSWLIYSTREIVQWWSPNGGPLLHPPVKCPSIVQRADMVGQGARILDCSRRGRWPSVRVGELWGIGDILGGAGIS